LYTYRFDANAPPTTGSIKLGMFKAVANQPWQVVAQTVVPTPVAGTAAAIGAIAPQSISAGSPFNLTPAIVGTAPFNWYLDAAPSGMTVNASTGEISWPNPVVSDTPYIIGVNAKNCAGGDSEVLTLTVTP
jgi:hypothetical protein